MALHGARASAAQRLIAIYCILTPKIIIAFVISLLLLPISRWYFGKIKRIEAEKKLLLAENDHGSYLIRDSESRKNDFSLSGKTTWRSFSGLWF